VLDAVLRCTFRPQHVHCRITNPGSCTEETEDGGLGLGLIYIYIYIYIYTYCKTEAASVLQYVYIYIYIYIYIYKPGTASWLAMLVNDRCKIPRSSHFDQVSRM
jgi:hypothetical protein